MGGQLAAGSDRDPSVATLKMKIKWSSCWRIQAVMPKCFARDRISISKRQMECTGYSCEIVYLCIRHTAHEFAGWNKIMLGGFKRKDGQTARMAAEQEERF